MADVKGSKPTRREKAAATRERMIRAAQLVFAEEGYVGARMTDIAVRAGVAVQTLYFAFHTKGELLQACYDDAVLGPEKLPPQAQPFYAEVFKARSGRTALAAFARGNGVIVARVAALDQAARAATNEPDAIEVRERSEALRRDGYRAIAQHVADRFGLRRGMEVEEATDIMLVLGSGAPYLAFTGYGWTHDRYVDWVADALARQLLSGS